MVSILVATIVSSVGEMYIVETESVRYQVARRLRPFVKRRLEGQGFQQYLRDSVPFGCFWKSQEYSRVLPRNIARYSTPCKVSGGQEGSQIRLW